MVDLVRSPGRIRDLAESMSSGALSAVELVERCLARIDQVDGQVQAWLYVDGQKAMANARALDSERRSGSVRGLLHGIPVGIKDVIDVAGLPTRANSPSRDGVPPARADATVVAHLRAAGAIVLGKVHTTEYAYFESLPPTRNPHDLSRTPGGSSAGSGAAIASGTVPLALGTQTAGSVNRPAAYTGVGAFKPSTLAIGGSGVVPLAPSFDTVGAFGATAQDAAILVAGYAGDHLGFSTSPRECHPSIVVLEDRLIEERASPSVLDCISSLTKRLQDAGLSIRRASTPVPLERVLRAHRIVMLAELGRIHASLPRDRVSRTIAEHIEEGLAISDESYVEALRTLAVARRTFWAAFGPDDLLLMPAAPDVAPLAGSTGDPSFIVPTTALGGPVATVGAGREPRSGMPVGALLLASPGADARLADFLRSPTGDRLGL